MPELPEVETVRRQLALSVTGMRVVMVDRVEPAMLRDCTEQQVWDLLPGSRVESVDRLGKFLILALSEDGFLTLHLGMTGSILVSAEPREEWGPHARFVFFLEDEAGRRSSLEFRDMRKFGRLHLTVGAPAPRLESLGPDAWQGAWDTAYLGGTAESSHGAAQGLPARPTESGRHREHLRRRDPLVDATVTAQARRLVVAGRSGCACRGDPLAAWRGRAAAGLFDIRFRRHRRKVRQFSRVVTGLRQAGAGLLAVRSRPYSSGGGGPRHGLLPRVPEVARGGRVLRGQSK